MPSIPVAITMGDPAGIGPEIIVKACTGLRDRLEAGELRLLIVGHRSAFDAAQALLGAAINVQSVGEGEDWPALAFLQAGEERSAIRPGALASEGGRFAYLAVERAVRLAQAGRIGG